LIMGATFKENVSDIRNSKVADIIKELQSYSLQVHVSDPHADNDELKHEYGFELTSELTNDYEAVIVAVPHKAYLDMDDSAFAGITKPNAMIADIKGVFRGKILSRKYWSL
jgi:UDP-N-acetyl-D-galactosamine dehydrogenase